MARWALVLLLLLPLPAGSTFAVLEPLVPANASAGDDVGDLVAMDLPWLAATAPGDNKVHVYHFDGAWRHVQSVGNGASGFGQAIALSDGRLAVGAPDANQVRTWSFDGTSWRPDTTLTGDRRFGSSLAMDGDTLVVGAPGAVRFGTLESAGAVHVFGYTSGWQQTATWERGGLGSETRFGAAVDVEGDQLIVGAPAREIEDEIFDGAAYIYERQGHWVERGHVRGDDRFYQTGAFGNLVAISSGRAVAGDPMAILDNVLIYGDLVFLERRGNAWVQTQQTYLDARAIDLDRDQFVTGGTYYDEVAVWEHSQGRWQIANWLSDPDGRSSSFGKSVAMDAGHLVVGDPDYRSSSGATGAAWPFVRNLAPVAVAGPDQSFKVESGTVRVQLDGRGSYDSDGTIESYAWSGKDFTADAATASVTLGIGTHKFSLKVVDDLGFSDIDAKTITVLEAPSLKASFTFSPDGALPGTEVRFTDKSNHESGTIMSWDWDFDGDDQVDATGQNPRHRFADSGSFATQLTVRDEHGATATATRQVRISDAAPIADAGDDVVVNEYDAAGQGIGHLDGRNSRDAEGPIKRFQWSIGGIPIGDTPTLDWTFNEGITAVRLLVQDAAGQTATDLVEVLVPRGGQNGTYGYNDPPDVSGNWRAHPQGVPRTLVFTDTSTDARTDVAFVSWDFDGDGDADSQAKQATWKFPGPGTFDVTHGAVDMDGARAERTFQVTVKDAAPRALFAMSQDTVELGAPVIFRDLSTDLEGPIVAWFWDFGQQTSARQDVGIVFQSAGIQRVQLRVTDDAGQTSSFNATVEVTAPPDTVTPADATDPVQELEAAGVEATEASDEPRRDAQGNILPGEEGSPFKITAETSKESGNWWLWLILALIGVGLIAWRVQRSSPGSRVR